MKIGTLTLLPALVSVLLGLGSGDAAARTKGYALPRASPEKLTALLDPGAGVLPGGYRFVGAKIDKVVILARYRSATGGPEITVLLGNPAQTRGKPLRTTKFALLLHDSISRKAPHGPGLMAALATHIKTREAAWRWIRVDLNRSEVTDLRQKYRLNVKPVYVRQWHGWALLLLLLLAPLTSWWYQRRRPAPPGEAPLAEAPPRWDRYDLIALGIVAGFVGSVLWPLLNVPITGDEATNLEPSFWTTWYLGGESSAHPPLFRFLIHLTARDVEPLWLLRGPVVLFAAGSLLLFWRLLRARTTPGLALALTAAVALSGNHWQHAFLQKSLWLWLLLLLAAQSSFERALAGTRSRWAHYALWATLATLTHYLSVAYLAGHFLHVVLSRRRELWSHVLALAPAALAAGLLSVAVLQGGAGRISGYDPAGSFTGQLLDNAFAKTGLLALLIAAGAVLMGPLKETRETGALASAGLGLVFTLGLATQMPLWPRYFFPVLPLGLLWLAGRLRWRQDRARQVQLVVLVLAGLLHFSNWRKVARESYGARPTDALYARYRDAAPIAPRERKPRVLLIHPGWHFPILYHELSGGRRHLRDTGCEGQKSPFHHIAGRELLVAVGHETPAPRLTRLLANLGRLHVLLYQARDGSTSPAVVRWVQTHCRKLYDGGSGEPSEAGRVYLCEAAQSAGANACKAVRRFERK